MEFAQEYLSSLAVDALLAEARLTPKPGLVDARSSDAHSDMDLALLEKSARNLAPFFRQAVQLGMHSPDCMPALQKAGLQAEHEMFSATGGVNTHKGALYSLGLLCAAIGQSLMTPCDIFALAAKFAAAGARFSAPSHGGSADLLSAALFLYNVGIPENSSFLKSKPTEVFL